MIIFLYGPDTFRSSRKLKEIIDYYKKIHKSGLNLIFFSQDNLDFKKFKEALSSFSIFKEKKLIILKDIFSSPPFKEEFLKEKEKILQSKEIIVIYEKKEISAKDSLFLFLKKNSRAQEFKFLTPPKLKAWLKKEFEKYQTPISPSALSLFSQFVGNDLWRADNEIKKLVNFKKGRKIEEKDIYLLVRPEMETDIFKTIDFIASKNKKLALKLLHRHLEKGEHPLYLLSMIIFQFRNLLEIRDLLEKGTPYWLLFRKSNLNNYVIKKSYQLAKKFSLSELKRIYRKIFEIDFNIKTGKLESETALDLLIGEI